LTSETEKFSRRFFFELLTIVLMWIGIVALLFPYLPADKTQLSLDYEMLHQRRMTYARDALLGPAHTLPAWYPREFMGTPFWSNVQNFPFFPTRLLILATFDPWWRYTYPIAMNLAAMLTALFTYLYCRRIGLGRIASAAAGWTFPCSGYFLSRVAAGHLPLLEAFCGLPLLLWIVESLVQRQKQNRRGTGWVLALALCYMFLSLAGHPQLPFYAMACAGVYLLWRCGIVRSIYPLCAMALGVGCAGFVVVPFVQLIGRSTRILPLQPADNDLALPYHRLLSFFRPWIDGAAGPLVQRGLPILHGYKGDFVFWDSVVYTGLGPWLALVLLLILCIKFKARSIAPRISGFLIAMGVAGLLLAMPFVQQLTSQVHATVLRSPERLIYLTEFALAIALAAAIDKLTLITPRRLAFAIVSPLLILHLADLSWHDHYFIFGTTNLPTELSNAIFQLLKDVGDGRAAIDSDLSLHANRFVDDFGFFDSITLAKTYKWVLAVSHIPMDRNMQQLDGGQVSERPLAATGVKVVVTMYGHDKNVVFYQVQSPASRAQLFDDAHVIFVDPEHLHDMLQDPVVNLSSMLLLTKDNRSTTHVNFGYSSQPSSVHYERPDSDHIRCSVKGSQSGYLRILESWDPGWSATIDSNATPVLAAMDAFLAVPISPGEHQVEFVYHTPGATAGICTSFVSMILLLTMLWLRRDQA
jgi:hypothetical protein